MNRTCQRRRFFIDRPVQGALLMRTLAYWSLTLTTQVLMILFFAVILHSPNEFYARVQELWWYLKLAVFASGLVLPLILVDVVRLSHRWVGPVFRLRTSLQALSRGEPVAPIRFREGDYWQDLARDFNAVAVELNRRRAAAPDEKATEIVCPIAGEASA